MESGIELKILNLINEYKQCSYEFLYENIVKEEVNEDDFVIALDHLKEREDVQLLYHLSYKGKKKLSKK